MPYPIESLRFAPSVGAPIVLSRTRRTWLLVQVGCSDQIRAAEAEARAVAPLVPWPLQSQLWLAHA